MSEPPVDPLETLQKHRAAGQPGRYPVRSRQEMREIARLLTLANPQVRARLAKESENGTLPTAIFIELVRQGYGMPEQKLKVEEGEQRQRPGLRTLRPIGWDPLNPDNPDIKVIAAIYERMPEIPPPALPAAPEVPVKGKGKAKGTIVPRPGLVPPQPEPDPPGVKRRVPKRPPEDDGSIPLIVDGV